MQSTINFRNILYFLAISFGLSWTVGAFLFLFDIKTGTVPALLLIALFYMPMPAVATIIVAKKCSKVPLSTYGLVWKGINRKTVLYPVGFYLSFLSLTFFLILLLGNLSGVEGFGRVSFSPGSVFANISKSTGTTAPPAGLPPLPVLVAAGTIGSILAGCTVNLPFALGEELGWRGFLYTELKTLGFWKSTLLTGIIWGIWHWPVIWLGHNYPSYPFWGSGMMLLFCVSLSLMHNIVRVKTGSVLGPAALHGMINAGAPMAVLFIGNNNVLLGSVVGAAGVLAALITSFIYLLLNGEVIGRYKTL
jgi:membrane protease YdiL (CAAX protease family)